MMSKFDELCAAYKNFRSEYSSVREDAISFSGWLVAQYLSYLGIDHSSPAFRLIPLVGEEKVNSTYSPFGATHLGDDGYWCMGIRLTIYEQKNMHPQLPLQIGIKFLRNIDSSHTVGLLGSDSTFKVSRDDDGRELNVFFDSIQKEIQKVLKAQADFLHGKNNKMSTIGFIQQQVDDDLKAESSGE
ncbi:MULTISPECIES: hypothetical protein [Enterobacter cloacae complex]|uniref:hypothetical protein n=2 Tax=Enterobacteriaceae TaxID=543 RepID=UPI000FFE8888|nr:MULTISPECIES: hypothetical protein [Enterobacter cloacae complex]